jgi:DNA polymerase III alpha subunit
MNLNLSVRLQPKDIGRQAEKIWKDWEAFAEYAFNKSHSTCYAWIA